MKRSQDYSNDSIAFLIVSNIILLSEGYAILLKSSEKARLTFLKHIYDYLTGSLTDSDKMNSEGLQFKDYDRFLELVLYLQGLALS